MSNISGIRNLKATIKLQIKELENNQSHPDKRSQVPIFIGNK